MIGTRHAVVVTHTRLRESGTVVEEAVEQLRRANFEVTIIDNIEAPEFGSRTGERSHITKAIEYFIDKNVGVEVIKDARATE